MKNVEFLSLLSSWNECRNKISKQLRKIIPGDIFVKESTKGVTEQHLQRSHIAIIANVPYDKEENVTIDSFLNKIIIIEAEYGGSIQSVIKCLSLGDYNRSNVETPKQVYDNLKIYSDQPLNTESWGVRRLMFKEEKQ